MEKIKSAVIEWLDDNYHFGDDSLGYVNLTMFLEKTFALKIDRKSLSRDNFDSMNKIAAYISSHPDFKAG